MRRPFCGKEMESGYVAGEVALIWQLRKRKVVINPYPNKKRGEFAFTYSWLGDAAAEGNLCRGCKRIVIAYEHALDLRPSLFPSGPQAYDDPSLMPGASPETGSDGWDSREGEPRSSTRQHGGRRGGGSRP